MRIRRTLSLFIHLHKEERKKSLPEMYSDFQGNSNRCGFLWPSDVFRVRRSSKYVKWTLCIDVRRKPTRLLTLTRSTRPLFRVCSHSPLWPEGCLIWDISLARLHCTEIFIQKKLRLLLFFWVLATFYKHFTLTTVAVLEKMFFQKCLIFCTYLQSYTTDSMSYLNVVVNLTTSYQQFCTDQTRGTKGKGNQFTT